MVVDNFGPPKQGAIDRIIGMSLAVVGDLPLIGGTVAEAMRQLFGTPLERRRDASLAMLADAVGELKSRHVDLDELAGREQWVTVALEAVRIAYGEHLVVKLEMLKAIVVNDGLRETDRAADVLTMRYLRWVDELEPEHIELLRKSGPDGDFAEVDDYLGLGEEDREQREMLVEDLQSRGLITSNLPARLVVEQTTYLITEATRNVADGITSRGRRFLAWLIVV